MNNLLTNKNAKVGMKVRCFFDFRDRKDKTAIITKIVDRAGYNDPPSKEMTVKWDDGYHNDCVWIIELDKTFYFYIVNDIIVNDIILQQNKQCNCCDRSNQSIATVCWWCGNKL